MTFRQPAYGLAMVTTDRPRSEALIRQLRAAGLHLPHVYRWGDSRGYLAMQHDRRTPILLDAPGWPEHTDLGWHVHALRTLDREVVVLATNTADYSVVLGSGASDMIARDLPAVRIASRVRSLPSRASAAPPEPAPRAPYRGRTPFLVSWLMRRRGRFCCHELRWLLGPPGRPLSLTDVRAQLRRVEPALRTHGRQLRQHLNDAAAATYLVEPLRQDPMEGKR